jgi:hypothetical protein
VTAADGAGTVEVRVAAQDTVTDLVEAVRRLTAGEAGS